MNIKQQWAIGYIVVMFLSSAANWGYDALLLRLAPLIINLYFSDNE